MSFSNFPAGTIRLAAAGATVPFVSDIEIVSVGGSGTQLAGIMFADTNVATLVTQLVKRNLSVYAVMGNDDQPVDHTGEWTSDVVVASEWEYALTNIVSGSYNTLGAAVGVYQTFAVADSLWTIFRLAGKGYTPGTSIVVGDFTIRNVATPANAVTFQVTLRSTQT